MLCFNLRLGNQARLLPLESHIERKERPRVVNNDVIRLYDISVDPAEKHNLASSNKRRVKKMLFKIRQFQKTAKKPLHSKLDERSDPMLYGGAWTPWLNDDDPS